MSTYITLAEAKAHLRVDFTDDDTYIQSLCDLVEEVVATEISGSTNAVGTISYASGSTSVSGTDTKFMDYTSGDIFVIRDADNNIKYNLTINSITDDTNLTFTSGFSTTNTGITDWTVKMGLPLETGTLPLGLKHAMLLLVGHFYANREPVIVGVSINRLPLSYRYLITPYKRFTII